MSCDDNGTPGVSGARRVRFSRVTDWVEGRLSSEQADAVAAAAATDPDLVADERWLRGFMAAAEAIPTEAPSPLVVQRLEQYFDRWARAQAVLAADVTPYRATLIFDSTQDRPFAGVRGESTSVNLVYGCEVGDLVIDVQPDETGRIQLLGQMMLNESTAAPYFEVTANGSDRVRHTESDDLGRFKLTDLPNDPVELVASNGEVQIAVTVALHQVGRT